MKILKMIRYNDGLKISGKTSKKCPKKVFTFKKAGELLFIIGDL